MPVYLLKSSRYREYHQENLRVLSGLPGDELEIKYGAKWIDPDLVDSDICGKPAVIVFSDSPYRTFVPVRMATVVSTGFVASNLILKVRLAGYPKPDFDHDKFSEQFSKCCRIGSQYKFLVESDNPLRLEPETDPDKILGAWRDTLIRMLGGDSGSAFCRSAFLLPSGLRDEDKKEVVVDRPLSVGVIHSQRIYSYTSHLPEEERSKMTLDLRFDSTQLEVVEQPEVLSADGPVELRFRSLVPGTATVQAHVLPYGERSNRLSLSYQVSTGVVAKPPQAKPELQTPKSVSAGLRRLHDVLGPDFPVGSLYVV